MADLERELMQVYASQQALCYYDPTLDAAARAAREQLMSVEGWQRWAAEQQVQNEGKARAVAEAEAAAKEAEDDSARLREDVTRLKRLLAEKEEERRRATQDALANRQLQEGANGHPEPSPMPVSSRAASSLHAEAALDGEGLDMEVQQALKEYEVLKLDRQPLQDVDRAEWVIRTMNVVNGWAYNSALGPSRLPLIDLLGPAQYASPLHFLKEVLQNFNDCRYPGRGCVVMSLCPDGVMLSANEEGVSAADVVALCSMGASTKTSSPEQTGRKGIGFKSVFLVTNHAMIFSGRALALAFGDPLNVRAPTGMDFLLPQVAQRERVPEALRYVMSELDTSGTRYTHLVLPYKPRLLEAHGDLTQQLLDSFDVYTLVTLDRIWSVQVRVCGAETQAKTYAREERDRYEAPSGYVRRSVTLSSDTGAHEMMVFDLDMKIDAEQVGTQQGMRRSTLRLGFPVSSAGAEGVDASGTGERPLFSVYATLPVDDVGLPFLLNGDWEVTTNRDMVQTSDAWNAALHRALPDALVRLYKEDAFFQAENGRRITDALPLKEEVARRRSGSYHWWLRFVRVLQQKVKDEGLLQRADSDKWVVADPQLQRLGANSALWSSVGLDVLAQGAHRFSPELLRLLDVKTVGWPQLATLIARAQEQQQAGGGELAAWLDGLRENRFEALYEYLASGATAEVTQLARQSGPTVPPNNALIDFSRKWAPLRIYRDASSGEYASFSSGSLAFLASSEEPALNHVLRLGGVPLLAQGTTEAERHVHWVLGLRPATGRLVSEELLGLYSLVQSEQQAASQDGAKYWGYLRVLAHLLETQVLAATEPKLAMLRLRCQGGQFKHINQVQLPSVLGQLLPEAAHQNRVAIPPEDCSAWSDVSRLGFELFLARLGCAPPSLAVAAGSESAGATRALVTIDVSELYQKPQDLRYLLQFGSSHRALLSSGAICVRSTRGDVPAYECFMPYMVEDEELPVVLLHSSIPTEACRPGQPLHEAMRVLGVRELSSPKYFVRAIRAVVEAQTEAELGGMPAFHRLRRTRAAEGTTSGDTELSDAELGLLKIRLVHKLLDGPRRVESEPGAEWVLSEAKLQLPCEGEDGIVLLQPRQLFLLDSYDEAALSPAQRAAYPLVVSLLNGVRASSRNNGGYLSHRPLLERLGCSVSLTVGQVLGALGRLRALEEEQKQKQQQQQCQQQQSPGSASQEGKPAGPAGVLEQEPPHVTLYRCLDDMLGTMGEEERRQMLAKVKLPTERGGRDAAERCAVPSQDMFKRRLFTNKGAPKVPFVAPALVGLTHLLSACRRQEDLIEHVMVSFNFRMDDNFLLAHQLTEAIKERLSVHGHSCPSLQIATIRSFTVKGTDNVSAIMAEYVLLEGCRAEGSSNDAGELVVTRPEPQEGQSPPCLLVLRLNVVDYRGLRLETVTLSEAFTRRLHASLGMLIQSQHGVSRDQAMRTAATVVREVHVALRVPDALLPASMTAMTVSTAITLQVPYASIFLTPDDEQHGMDGCLSLLWQEPTPPIRAGGGGPHGHHDGAGGGRVSEEPRDRPREVQVEMTRAQYQYILEQGAQAECYADKLLADTLPEHYNPETCWLSENKRCMGHRGRCDDTAGYDFKLQLGDVVVLIEVKGTSGSVRDAQVLLSRNQIKVMQQAQLNQQTLYLVMVVGHMGLDHHGHETHRFFTCEEVEELGCTQQLCQVRGEGQTDLSACVAAGTRAADQWQGHGSVSKAEGRDDQRRHDARSHQQPRYPRQGGLSNERDHHRTRDDRMQRPDDDEAQYRDHGQGHSGREGNGYRGGAADYPDRRREGRASHEEPRSYGHRQPADYDHHRSSDYQERRGGSSRSSRSPSFGGGGPGYRGDGERREGGWEGERRGGRGHYRGGSEGSGDDGAFCEDNRACMNGSKCVKRTKGSGCTYVHPDEKCRACGQVGGHPQRR